MNYHHLTDQQKARREKLNKLKALKGQLDPYQIETVTFNTTISQINAQYASSSLEEISQLNQRWILGGRISHLRLPFGVLSYQHAELQVYFANNHPAFSSLLQLIDLGDFVQVSGQLFFTKTNHLTLKADSLTIIAKALLPLPDQHYGFKDVEQRLRKRYLDTITHQSVWKLFYTRAKIIASIREFLNNQGYLEVETPVLQPTYGGANARPFITYHNSLKQNFYLRIAPELSLKKMIIGGLEKVYELGKCFRNEGIDATHNPEFTSLEIYTSFFGLKQTMTLTEQLFRYVAQSLNISKINKDELEIDLNQPFQQVRMTELVRMKTGIDFYHHPPTLLTALNLAANYGIQLLPHQKTLGHILTLLFEHLCEHELLAPTFVTGYHQDVSPLAKADPKNAEFTLRFELFIGGKEFANGFAELNNPDEQLARFQQQTSESALGNDEANQIDESFIEALKYGLVPTGGVGIGIDRLINLFTNTNSIKEVIFFPTLKKY